MASLAKALVAYVQIRTTGGGGGEWWETIAGFNSEIVTIKYARKCSAHNPTPYRVVNLRGKEMWCSLGYELVDKHPAYEVWKNGSMVSRHPNKPEATAAIRRYNRKEATK